MQPSTNEAFEQALRDCAAEPIHLIGQVQPHAALLSFESDGGQRVMQASSNLAAILGRDASEVLGRP